MEDKGHLLCRGWGIPTGGDGSPDVVEQVACIHWWPCSGVGVPT